MNPSLGANPAELLTEQNSKIVSQCGENEGGFEDKEWTILQQHEYSTYHPLCRKVLKMKILGVPLACVVRR